MATNDKYDRQLRLWGANGQKALSETTVMLLRATAAGTETLKNLVLPGVGKIVVVDDAILTDMDVQSNFFVTMSTTTTTFEPVPRAKIALELLQELNPDVQGSYLHVADLSDVNYAQLFASYTNLLVIGADLEPSLADAVAHVCSLTVPFIHVQSYGLLGLVRLQAPRPLCVFDSKPASSTPDLRLVTPFPAFVEYCNSINMESADMDDHQYSHVPYPVILYKLQYQWKVSHQGALPKTFAEKQEFREHVKKMARKWDQQVNFHEAYNNAYLAYTEKTLDINHIEGLLEKLQGHPTTSTSTSQQLLSALIKFLHNRGGHAPLGGTLPDMTASTQSYVQLQQLYHDQAQKDALELRSYLEQDASGTVPTDEEVSRFCANVFELDILVLRSCHDEYQVVPPPQDLVEDWHSLDPYEVPEQTPLLWYVGLRACRLFHIQVGRYPGVTSDWESDVDLVQEKILQVCRDMQLLEGDNWIQQTLVTSNTTSNMAAELTRYGNAELHVIASIVGGVASQEAVKLITGQYTPLNNTYVYNGIASVGAVYQF